MNPFRCSHCDKLLGMIEGKAEIKCSKCKTMNRTEGNERDSTTTNGVFVETYGVKDRKKLLKLLIDTQDAHLYEMIPKPHDNESKFIQFKDIAHEKIDADTWKDKFKIEY